ncbi:MAG: hypothetical protein IKR86_02100 [Candidatus Methanomethylophilaceae archaeon]|nr:hypothetical protein [Candidatus Methanomethylophilaceae archaeon]
MEAEERRLIFTDEPSEAECDSIVSVAGKRLRRCVGCVRCLTETPGRCAIKDAFPEMSDRMMDSDVLEIRSEAFEGGFSPTITKAVERLSNELQAFTDLGGAVPRDKGEVRLRRIEIVMRGVPEDRERFESDTEKSLGIGPVEKVSFSYE